MSANPAPEIDYHSQKRLHSALEATERSLMLLEAAKQCVKDDLGIESLGKKLALVVATIDDIAKRVSDVLSDDWSLTVEVMTNSDVSLEGVLRDQVAAVDSDLQRAREEVIDIQWELYLAKLSQRFSSEIRQLTSVVWEIMDTQKSLLRIFKDASLVPIRGLGTLASKVAN